MNKNGNGDSRTNGATRNGDGLADHEGSVSTEKDADKLGAIAEKAVAIAIERENAADPLAQDSIYPELLLGAQMPTRSARWSPDPRLFEPVDSAAYVEAESDPDRMSPLDSRYVGMLKELESLDEGSGFDHPS